MDRLTKPFMFTLLRDLTVPGDVLETTRHLEEDEDPHARAQAFLREPIEAEELGFDRFSVGDHMYDSPESLIDCMAAAAATKQLKITQTVLMNDFRHPTVVAKAIASIDVFSGGRAQVGLGAGYNEDEYRQAGVQFDPAPVRVARLREAAQIIKAALHSDEPVYFDGEHYKVDGFMCLPRPVQQPGPPICIGGGGKKILQIAAEFADIVDVAPRTAYPSGLSRIPRQYTREAAVEKLEWLKECAGERFDDLILTAVIFKAQFGEDREEAARQVQAEFDAAYRMYGHEDGFDVSIEEILSSPYYVCGNEDDMVEHFLEIRRELGITGFLVFPDYMHKFKPVMDRLRREDAALAAQTAAA
jgi:probable F420-dependent oxidoreductase